MKDLELFEKYQKQLVWFINTKLGRWFFKVDDEIRNICKVEPNALTYDKRLERRDDGEWYEVKTTCFRTNNKYAALLNYRLAPLHKLALLLPSLARPELSPFLVPVMLTVDTYYPAAGASSPVDGHVGRNNVTEDFSVIRSGDGKVNSSTATSITVSTACSGVSNKFAAIYRGILLFATSSIGTDNIDSAVLSLYGYSKYCDINDNVMHICQSNPQNDNAVTNSDYQGMKDYNTSFGSITQSSFSLTGYNDIALNSSGISNINKGGISKFGLRTGSDLSGTTPSWAADGGNFFSPYSADYGNTSRDPKLTVTHSVVITFIPQIMFL